MLTKTGNQVIQPGYLSLATGPPWRAALLCVLPASLYYAALLASGSLHFFDPVPHGLTFNSMLAHMLQGSFDVDPDTIRDEGFLRDGRVYAYFGIFPALLRLPFLLLPNFATAELTRLSCLAAVIVMAFFKLAAAQTVWRANGSPGRSVLLTLFTIAIVLSGPQIEFLRALIYQEVLLWAGALSAAFIYMVLQGYYSERGFTSGRLGALALIAGLCLLTRVSTALGLFAAFGLLWLALAWPAVHDKAPGNLPKTEFIRFLGPPLILSFFLAVAGYVNYSRWGNPLEFADFRLYLWPIIHDPARFSETGQYGQFNWIRVGYGLAYYFFPLWVLHTADGSLLWSAFQHRTIDTVELPPSSFFISDPLIIGVAGFALIQLVRNREVFNRAIAVPVMLGLAVPAVLVLSFIGMTFRYRMEFYPFFEFCAFLGFGALLARQKSPPVLMFAIAVAIGIIASHVLWFLYMLTPFANGASVLGGLDVISFYRSMLP